MAHPRRFRFGVQLSNAPTGADWLALARKAEDLGYSTLFMPDHFGDQFAPLPALAAAAVVTTELHLGALVFDNDYRHPLLLAKEIATLDVISDGRVEVGLGAGWMRSDYDESVIPYDPPSVRVDRFEEGLRFVSGLLGPYPVPFEGTHYRISAHPGLPKPGSKPPILVGGGMKRMLSIAGRHADIVGINPSIPNGAIDSDAARDGLAEATDRKLGWVRDAAGARYEDLEINLLNFACIVTDDRDSVVESFAPALSMTTAELASLPHALIGTVEQICDQIVERRDRWDASYVVVQGDAMETFAPVVARLAGT